MKYLALVFFLVPFSAIGQQPKLVLPVGHTSFIESVEFSPDGKKIVTSAFDNTAKIWDRSGVLLANLVNHKAAVKTTFFSKDGKYILTGSFDSTAILWNAEDGKQIRTVRCNTGRISSAEFTPDGNHIVTIGEDHSRLINGTQTMIYGNQVIDVFDTHTGILKFKLDKVWGNIEDMEFTADSRYLLTVVSIREDFKKKELNQIVVWDLLNGSIVYQEAGHHATISTEKRLISISIYDKIFLRNFPSGDLYTSGKLTDMAIRSVQFSGNDDYLFGHSDSAIFAWNYKTDSLKTVFKTWSE
jgi:WD40 repeat protein